MFRFDGDAEDGKDQKKGGKNQPKPAFGEEFYRGNASQMPGLNQGNSKGKGDAQTKGGNRNDNFTFKSEAFVPTGEFTPTTAPTAPSNSGNSNSKHGDKSNSQNPSTLNVGSVAFSKGNAEEGTEGVKRVFAQPEGGASAENSNSLSRSPRPVDDPNKGINVTAPQFKPTLDATSASPK